MYEIKATDNCSKRIDGTNKIICLSDRWSTSLVQELIRDLNITIFFKKAKDKQYGIKVGETENWTGIMGLLQQNKADLTFDWLTFTASRANAVDFGTPLGFQYQGLYMVKMDSRMKHVYFLDIFSTNYWTILCITAIIAALFLSLLVHNSPENNRLSLPTHNICQSESIRTGMAMTYLAFLGLDVYSAKRTQDIPSSLSIRIFILTVCVLGMIALNTFYAGLASRLTIENTPTPIDSLEDIANNPSYRLTIQKGGNTESFFAESCDLPIRKIWNNRKSQIVYHTDKILAENQILRDPTLVLSGANSFEETSKNYPCKITKLSKTYSKKPYGFAFTPNSAYQKLLNFKIMQYKMFGINDHLAKDTINSGAHGCKETTTHQHALGYSDIIVPFWIVAVGLTFSLLFIFVELIVYKIIYLKEFSQISTWSN